MDAKKPLTISTLGKLLTSSLLLLMATSVGAAERVVRESIPVNSDVNFTIDSHRGGVRITTGEVENIEITAVISHDDEDVLDNVDIDIYSSRDRVRVEVEYSQSWFNFDSIFSVNSNDYPDIQFDIVLPDAARLNVDSHRSRLDIEAPSGPIRISTHRGQGRLSGIRNDLSLDTHRGDFELEIVELHDVRIDTHRGDISLDILTANNFSIDAETHRGNFSVMGKNVPVERDDRNRFIDYQEGDGSNLIKVESHRGDIEFNFLN